MGDKELDELEALLATLKDEGVNRTDKRGARERAKQIWGETYEEERDIPPYGDSGKELLVSDPYKRAMERARKRKREEEDRPPLHPPWPYRKNKIDTNDTAELTRRWVTEVAKQQCGVAKGKLCTNSKQFYNNMPVIFRFVGLCPVSYNTAEMANVGRILLLPNMIYGEQRAYIIATMAKQILGRGDNQDLYLRLCEVNGKRAVHMVYMFSLASMSQIAVMTKYMAKYRPVDFGREEDLRDMLTHGYERSKTYKKFIEDRSVVNKLSFVELCKLMSEVRAMIAYFQLRTIDRTPEDIVKDLMELVEEEVEKSEEAREIVPYLMLMLYSWLNGVMKMAEQCAGNTATYPRYPREGNPALIEEFEEEVFAL